MNCPPWCEGNHRPAGEHSSRTFRYGGTALELMQFPGEEPQVTIMEGFDGGAHVTLPLDDLPHLVEGIGTLYHE